MRQTVYGILIPFLGTTLGAACVFFMRKQLGDAIQRILTGFAAGVMVAASVWSLLIPAMEQAAWMGKLSFLPAFSRFWIGILFLLGLDHLIPHLHAKSNQAEGPKSQLKKTTMMVLAVTLHNIPEGMAVGVVYAGVLSGSAQITATGALALSIGIAIQNFPEGAIISLPLRAEGESKGRAFLGGVLSGIVEPIGAVLTILGAGLIVPALPYLLSFAAGAMVADAASIASGLCNGEKKMAWQSAPDGWVTPFEELSFSYYVRVKTDDPAQALEAAALALGTAEKLPSTPAGYVEYITPEVKESEARRLFSGELCKAESVIRILAK